MELREKLLFEVQVIFTLLLVRYSLLGILIYSHSEGVGIPSYGEGGGGLHATRSTPGMEALKQMDLKQGYCFKAWLAKGTLGQAFPDPLTAPSRANPPVGGEDQGRAIIIAPRPSSEQPTKERDPMSPESTQWARVASPLFHCPYGIKADLTGPTARKQFTNQMGNHPHEDQTGENAADLHDNILFLEVRPSFMATNVQADTPLLARLRESAREGSVLN
ncbi:zinc finger protein mex-5 [Striga asiatica]|uniref:Zinc finger protein mex-5 n=1 Tax=Striga asiatica TaxID=4170 RepID=A0A5A7QKY7_STRAF|nr:zinc finger protein mex-5 [Striga asiatica]